MSKKYRYHKHEGLGEVYRKCKDSGYKRSYESMCKQLKKLRSYEKQEKIRYPKSRYEPLKGTYPGEFVQIDVKYVPLECIGFKSSYQRYYQITAIDLYSRKRVLKLVKENSTYEISKMLVRLENDFRFKIKQYRQTTEESFVMIESKRSHCLERVIESLRIEYIRTRPYSPWQNGVVERSHKIDNELFYSRRRFKSEEEIYKSFKRYSARTNNIARRVLGFKTPNEYGRELF